MKKLLLMIFAALTLTGCDEIFPDVDSLEDLDALLSGKEPKEKIKINEVKFSPDYKTFVVTANTVDDIGPYMLSDTSQVSIRISETINGREYTGRAMPRLVKVTNVEAESFHKLNVYVLALIDRTLPQKELDHIREQMKEMLATFTYDNLYLAFMQGDKVTETMKATPYVLNKYFSRTVDGHVRLYRSILQKEQEMQQRQGVWSNASHMAMIVFSDEKVYADDSDEPIDPDHYKLEEQMTAPLSADSVSVSVTYASHNQHNQDAMSDSRNVLTLYCDKHNGMFMSNFTWVSFRNLLLSDLHQVFPSNEFHFVNPDLKVYRGAKHDLNLSFYDVQDKRLLTTATTTVRLGSIENPIIVHDSSTLRVIAQGLLFALLILLVVYLVMQLLVPFAGWCLFRRKYVLTYTSSAMSTADALIAESCYLCKAPFQPGDKIVTRCEHTTHLECWEENDHHCPEYGDRCQHGSYYYNRKNPFDRRNTSFYTHWVLMSIVAATLSWLCYTLLGHSIDTLDGVEMTEMPSVGLFIGFFMTLGISFESTRWQYFVRHLPRLLLRALLTAAACYLVFLLTGYAVQVTEVDFIVSILNVVPWAALAALIAVVATWGTRVRLRKILIAVGVGLGVLSMYVWAVIFIDMQLSYRVLLIFSFIIFCAGLGLSVASVAPKSSRYFLKMQGATKDTDIALYKWFRNQPDYVVSIGKSVDSSIQMSWEINSDIAPIQAKIRMDEDCPFLIAVEPGVYLKDKPLEVDKRILLQHGSSFTIGKTCFTYIEKDHRN